MDIVLSQLVGPAKTFNHTMTFLHRAPERHTVNGDKPLYTVHTIQLTNLLPFDKDELGVAKEVIRSSISHVGFYSSIGDVRVFVSFLFCLILRLLANTNTETSIRFCI